METVVHELEVGTDQITDITGLASDFVAGKGDGLMNLFLPHATAGLALIEVGAGSDIDLVEALEDVLPRTVNYRHVHGTPGHGRDHILPALISPSLSVPVVSGSLALGPWQSLVIVDTNVDNHIRALRLTFLQG